MVTALCFAAQVMGKDSWMGRLDGMSSHVVRHHNFACVFVMDGGCIIFHGWRYWLPLTWMPITTQPVSSFMDGHSIVFCSTSYGKRFMDGTPGWHELSCGVPPQLCMCGCHGWWLHHLSWMALLASPFMDDQNPASVKFHGWSQHCVLQRKLWEKIHGWDAWMA